MSESSRYQKGQEIHFFYLKSLKLIQLSDDQKPCFMEFKGSNFNTFYPFFDRRRS